MYRNRFTFAEAHQHTGLARTILAPVNQIFQLPPSLADRATATAGSKAQPTHASCLLGAARIEADMLSLCLLQDVVGPSQLKTEDRRDGPLEWG
jgi:hypothetical protein